MASDFLRDHAERAMPWEGRLSSAERRKLSQHNLAGSKEAAKERKRIQKAKAEEHSITEAERFAMEQALIIEQREFRHAMTEENRRQAVFSGVFYDDAAEQTAEHKEINPQPEEPPQPMPEPPEENDIDIDIPTEQAAPAKPASKKKKKTKHPEDRAVSRATSGKRYSKAAEAAKKRNHISAGGAIALGILTGLLIGTVIYGRVQTNEIYTEIAALQTEYDDLTAKNISMRSEMESKLTVKKIEEYAEDVLGLMPLNQSQIEYIQLQTEDEVVITEPEDNFFVEINDYLVSIWEYFRGK